MFKKNKNFGNRALLKKKKEEKETNQDKAQRQKRRKKSKQTTIYGILWNNIKQTGICIISHKDPMRKEDG